MNQDLRRYSSIGDLNGILFFAKHVLTKEKAMTSTLKTDCSSSLGLSINYSCAVSAFEYLGLIHNSGRYLVPTSKVLYNGSIEDLIKDLSKEVIKVLIDEGLINIDKIVFDESSHRFTIPRQAFSLDSAVFRNMLLSMGTLILKNDLYYIQSDYSTEFSGHVSEKRHKLKLEELERILQEEKLIGEAGEEYVLKREKERLQTSNLADSIQQVSLIDVSAGYDIASFIDSDSSDYDHFIEVKTYRGTPHFFWSSNEMSVAKLRRDLYWICLVDYDQINNADYQPIWIQNPYENIINSPEWKSEVETMRFEKISL